MTYTIKIYKVYNNQDDKIFISSTKQRLSNRMANYRSLARCNVKKNKLYNHMRKIGISSFFIVELQRLEVLDVDEQYKAEHVWVQKLKPSLQSKKKLTSDQLDKLRQKKCYYNQREKRLKYQKEYYEKNRERINLRRSNIMPKIDPHKTLSD